MKKNCWKKLFGLALAASLSLILTACGNDSTVSSLPADSASASSVRQETPASAGSLLLSVNPEIELHYDKEGNAVSLTGLNEDGRKILASFTGYEGSPCKTVLGELVNEINAAGYFDATIDGKKRNIVLKLARGSRYPSEGFLDELADEVRNVVDTDKIGSQTVALDDDDYDEVYGDKGYINEAAAKSLLSAQLGRSDIQFLEKEYDLDDGEYEVEFVLDGVKYEYEVNALTGKVTEVDVERPNSGTSQSKNSDYGPGNDGVTDYDDTDYGPNNDGVTDYDDTDYGPNNDGVTDYDDTDYGPNNDGVTDYDDTDYGPNNDGVTDYDDTDYGPNNDGVTDYDDTDYDDDDDDDWDD